MIEINRGIAKRQTFAAGEIIPAKPEYQDATRLREEREQKNLWASP